jgi:hypothetical protein
MARKRYSDEDAWNTRDVTVRLNSVDLGRRFRSLAV